MKRLENHSRGTLWILGAACSYATVAIFGKWVFVLQIPMWTALSWRYGIAAFIFWIWINRQNILYRKSTKPDFISPPLLTTSQKRSCFLIGLLGDTCRTTLFFLTISKLGASLASLLLFTFPFFVFLWQRFIFQQPASKTQWLGLSLSSLGCFFAIIPWEGQIQIEDWSGVLCGLGSGFVESCYIVFSHRLTKNITASSVASYVTRGAFLSLAIMALWNGQFYFPSTSTEWSLAVSIAIFATVIPVFCLMKGLQKIGAAQASLLFTIEPIITIWLAVYLFGEPFTLAKMIGSALILGSAILIQRKQGTPACLQKNN